jgi:hypothetical protein
MRQPLILAALVFAALLHRPALAGHHSKKDSGPKVTINAKSALRAEPSDTGMPVGKVRAGEKVVFVKVSDDGKWVQVRKGRFAGWIAASEVDNLPSDATLPKAPTGPTEVTPPVPTPVVTPVPVAPVQVQPVTPVQVQPVAPVQVQPVAPVQVQPVAPVQTPPPSDTPALVPVPAPVPAGGEVGAPPPAPVVAPRLPLSGLLLGVGGGVALLTSQFSSTFKSGLQPELFNYNVQNLPALALAAHIGYTYGYRGFRLGVDAGYRFAGATAIVVKLPEKDSLPLTVMGSAATMSEVLPYERQVVNVTSHDVDAAASIGGYFTLGKYLEMSLRARGGLQVLAFVPQFNSDSVLPQEVFYGPMAGGVIDFQSRAVPGFGLHVEGAYIPYAVRQEPTGGQDVAASAANTGNNPEKSTGYNVAGSLAFRVAPGFDVELGYRMLFTQTQYGNDPNAADSYYSPRMAFNRDPTLAYFFKTELLTSAQRTTEQQSIYLGVTFRR